MQGRFTLDVIRDSDHFNDMLYDLSGGLWANYMNSRDLTLMRDWRGEVSVEIKYRNGREQDHSRPSTEGGWHTSGVPQVGDSPHSTNLTWLPMRSTVLYLEPRDIKSLLTGEAVIVLQTGLWGWIHQGQDFSSHWTPLSEHVLTLSNQYYNNYDQLVIRASRDILQMIISELKSFGHVWIGQEDVTKSEFDAFWTSLFSQHGNDTPQARRASVLALVSRPSFVDEPEWQAHLCLAILANPKDPDGNPMHFYDSGLVLGSRRRPRRTFFYKMRNLFRHRN